MDEPCKIPDGLIGLLGGRVGKIHPCSVDSHAFIEIADLSQDEVDDLLDALRRALPEGTALGLTERKDLIHVELS